MMAKMVIIGMIIQPIVTALVATVALRTMDGVRAAPWITAQSATLTAASRHDAMRDIALN